MLVTVTHSGAGLGTAFAVAAALCAICVLVRVTEALARQLLHQNARGFPCTTAFPRTLGRSVTIIEDVASQDARVGRLVLAKEAPSRQGVVSRRPGIFALCF